jgi:hypothetical protein
MSLDFVILLATIAGLSFVLPGGRSGLWKMLFADGLAYFTLVASVNAIPAVRPRSPVPSPFFPFVPYLLAHLGRPAPPIRRCSTSSILIVRVVQYHYLEPDASTAAMNV